MNAEFVSPFLSAISNVLATMAMIEPKSGEPTVECAALPPAGLTGIIKMYSPQVTGALAISFSRPLILEMTRRVFGGDDDLADDTLENLVGEITNIVCGNAKGLLEQEGYDFSMASPLVVKNRDPNAIFPMGCTVIVVPFSTEFGDFFVELGFAEVSQQAAS